jgi:hypothetical protein
MFYIFLIAVLNLGLGFAAAMRLGRQYDGLSVVSTSLNSIAAGLSDSNDGDESESDFTTGEDEG